MTPVTGALPWVALLTIWMVWGSTYLAIRIVVHDMPPLSAAALRFLVAGTLMALAALFVDRSHGRPSPRQIADYSLVGLLLLAVGNGLVMWAEKSVPSGIAALIVATVPLWLTLLEGFQSKGASWSGRSWVGVLIGLAGVAFVAQPGGADFAAQWTGMLALQVASFSWCLGSVYVKGVRKKLPLVTASAVQMLAGGAVLLAESWLKGESWSQLWSAPAEAWAALGYLVVAGSLIGFTAFAYCLSVMPASVVGTYAYVNPVVAVALGALVLDEPLSHGLVLGGALIVVAVILTTTGRPSPRPVATESQPRRAAA